MDRQTDGRRRLQYPLRFFKKGIIIFLPTYPSFCWYATGTTHIFFFRPKTKHQIFGSLISKFLSLECKNTIYCGTVQ